MQYNDLIYKSGPTNINDYISNKYNIIHTKLYEDALYNYITDFAKKLVMSKLFYGFFVCMSNCSKDNFEIFNSLDSITNNKDQYVSLLMNYIDNSEYYEDIYEVIDLLNNDYMDNNYNNIKEIISYIVDKVIMLITELQTNITDNIDYPLSPLDDLKEKLDTNTDFSNFVIRQDHKIYMISEDNDFMLFELEDNYEEDNTVFIYEEEQETKSYYHIGFNEDGKFVLDIDPNIDIYKHYKKLTFIMTYINTLLSKILYQKIYDIYITRATIIEQPKDEYYLPSTIIIYGHKYPHKKTVVDLTPYWSTYQKPADLDISDVKIIEEQINDAEVQSIDYVHGTLDVYSRMHDINYTVSSKYANENTNVNNDMLKDTFTQKLINRSINII